jgi:hypothetical protein
LGLTNSKTPRQRKAIPNAVRIIATKARVVIRLRMNTNFDPCFSSNEPMIIGKAVKKHNTEKNINGIPGCTIKYRKADRPIDNMWRTIIAINSDPIKIIINPCDTAAIPTYVSDNLLWYGDRRIILRLMMASIPTSIPASEKIITPRLSAKDES